MRVTLSSKALICLGVRQVVRDVGEPRAARLESLNECEGLLYCLVHGMRDISQGVQHQIVESFEQCHRRVRNLAEVGQVGGSPKPETQYFHLPVEQGHGNKRSPEKFKRTLDGVQRDARYGAERRLFVENVSEDAPNDAKRSFVAIDR